MLAHCGKTQGRLKAGRRWDPLGKDQSAALVERRVLGPHDLPSVALGIDELETATAEREILWLAYYANPVEALQRFIRRVDARRVLEIDREHDTLEGAGRGRGSELLFVVRSGKESEDGAARLERDEALVAELRLGPAELAVEARHRGQVANRQRHEARARWNATSVGPRVGLARASRRVALGRRLAQELADVHALRRRFGIAHALAPVYDRRPRRQNRDARTNAAMVPRMRNPRPSGSSLPAITCAGTVTATPIGTALDSVTRSHPGYTSTGNLPASMNDQ